MTMQPELFKNTQGVLKPAFDGKQLRDQGIKQVSNHNESWMEKCIKYATERAAKATRDFTGEDIRFSCELAIGSPNHPNGWGALTNALVKRKIIVPTGEWRKAKNETSHARNIQVYRKAT